MGAFSIFTILYFHYYIVYRWGKLLPIKVEPISFSSVVSSSLTIRLDKLEKLERNEFLAVKEDKYLLWN